MTQKEQQGSNGHAMIATSLNVRQEVTAAYPSLHFPVMNGASCYEHHRQVAVAGPFIHDALRKNTAPAPLYPERYQKRTVLSSASQVTQSQQEIHLHPQVRSSTLEVTESQQPIYFHPQVQPSTSQVVQPQQVMDLHPQMRPSTSQAVRSQQEMAPYPQKRLRTLRVGQSEQHIRFHPQVRPTTSQAIRLQQQIHLYPQVRPSTSQAINSQHQIRLHPQEQPNYSQYSQQQINLYPQVQPSTAQMTQSQQQIHIHPQAQPNASQYSQQQINLYAQSTAQTTQSQQQIRLHPQEQSNTSQGSQQEIYRYLHQQVRRAVDLQQEVHLHSQARPSAAQVTRSQRASVALPRAYDIRQPHPISVSHNFTNSKRTAPSKGLVERKDRKSQQSFEELKKAFLREQQQILRYREAYLRLGAAARVCQDSSRRGTAGCGQVLLQRGQNEAPARSSHSHSSQVDRNVLYELLKRDRAQTSRDSVHAPCSTHAEPRVGDSALQFSTQGTCDEGLSQRSTSLGDCGGYAVDHESFPIIVAVHSAGAHGKGDVSTPRRPSQCTREETPQYSNDEVITTKVSFQDSESSFTSPANRSSPVHDNSLSKKKCVEPLHFEQPANVQVAGTSEPLHTDEEPRQVNHGTSQQFAPSVTDTTESCQTLEQTYLLPQQQEIPDAARELNNQTPSKPTNEYLNVQDFFESHTQTASKQGQESSTIPTVAVIELDFGGPPPYLPLREPCEETIQDASGSSGAAPQQRCELNVNRKKMYRIRTASPDQETEYTRRRTKNCRSKESHRENSSEQNEESPVSPKLPRKAYTLELLCSKISHTRERIKNEEIPWKKKVLHRLEAMFVKRLIRMERETGRKADIDIPREDLSKKKAKRRNSRLSSDKKELNNVENGETKKLSNETEGKEEDLQKFLVDESVKQGAKCGGDPAKPNMNRSPNKKETTRQTNNQEIQNAVCQEITSQRKSQEQVDAACWITAPECRRTFSSDKSAGIKRAVIKPCLYEKHEAAIKHPGADQRGTADKPKDYHSTENAPPCTCQDTCLLEEKPKDKCIHDEKLPLSKPNSSPECNRNIWSFLKTFTE